MPRAAYNSIMKQELVYTGNNIVGKAKNLQVFIECHSFLTNFIILENMNKFVEKGLTEVISMKKWNLRSPRLVFMWWKVISMKKWNLRSPRLVFMWWKVLGTQDQLIWLQKWQLDPMQSPKGIVKNVLVKIHKFIFSVDFVILDIVKDKKVSIILGRPKLATTHARIDGFGGKLSLEVGKQQVIFNANEGATPITISPIYELLYTRNNIVGKEKNLQVFIRSHSFLTNFNILENMNEFVEKGPTEIILGSLYEEMEFEVSLTRFHVMERLCIGVTIKVTS
nr:hypothetical protein [Tanacetum cinerariifolium]